MNGPPHRFINGSNFPPNSSPMVPDVSASMGRGVYNITPNTAQGGYNPRIANRGGYSQPLGGRYVTPTNRMVGANAIAPNVIPGGYGVPQNVHRAGYNIPQNAPQIPYPESYGTTPNLPHGEVYPNTQPGGQPNVTNASYEVQSPVSQAEYNVRQQGPQVAYGVSPNVSRPGYCVAPNQPQAGYGSPSNSPHYGFPPNAPRPGYGGTPNVPQPTYGAPANQPQTRYGAPPNVPQFGYGGPPNAPRSGYGIAPNARHRAYGAYPNQPQAAYGVPPNAPRPSYGIPPNAPRYGGPSNVPGPGYYTSETGYGVPPSAPYYPPQNTPLPGYNVNPEVVPSTTYGNESVNDGLRTVAKQDNFDNKTNIGSNPGADRKKTVDSQKTLDKFADLMNPDVTLSDEVLKENKEKYK